PLLRFYCVQSSRIHSTGIPSLVQRYLHPRSTLLLGFLWLQCCPNIQTSQPLQGNSRSTVNRLYFYGINPHLGLRDSTTWLQYLSWHLWRFPNLHLSFDIDLE